MAVLQQDNVEKDHKINIFSNHLTGSHNLYDTLKVSDKSKMLIKSYYDVLIVEENAKHAYYQSTPDRLFFLNNK